MREPSRLHSTRKLGWRRRVRGHLQTVLPTVHYGLRGAELPEAELWQQALPNEFGDPIVHSGRFRSGESDKELVVILHGLGGHVDRGYCLEAAEAAAAQGLSTLRLFLRGADGVGRDFYHAGLTVNLGPLLRSKPWDGYEKIALVGYSLGGHIALKAALDGVDERIVAVAAICPPLDLKECQRHIDHRTSWLYRRAVLRALVESYPNACRSAMACRRVNMPPFERIRAVQTLRQWDELCVVSRFGFDDVDHYYRSQSVGPRLSKMSTAALVVASPADPMIPADSLRGPLSRSSARVEVRWVESGGHVFFPEGVELGFGAQKGVPAQVMSWLQERF